MILPIRIIKARRTQRRLDSFAESFTPQYRNEMLGRVPVVPGRYRDEVGDVWTLGFDGRWTDKHGVTLPVSYNWALGLPSWHFTKIE